MASSGESFLGLEACHAFVTGAAGGVGIAVVKELLGTTMQTHIPAPMSMLRDFETSKWMQGVRIRSTED